MIRAIKNAKLVLPDQILTGKTLFIEDGRISAIQDASVSLEGADAVTDAHGRFLMPGFIDVHSDRIEQFILPRPTARLNFELAMKECERELLCQGITMMYHSLSLYKDELLGKSPLRTKESVEQMAALIEDLRTRYHLIHHRFHLRLEIDNVDAFPVAKEMIEKKRIHEISFMDHTPGQGQYRSLEVYKETVRTYGGRESKSMTMEEILAYHDGKDRITLEQMKELAALAHENGIAVASHDDDTVQKLELNRQIGVDISEFPISLATAKAAREKGFATVVGAPNILLGGSHSGNMSAAEAIRENCADILCSDYYPPAILHSIFTMWKQYGCDLPELVAKATRNPARAMGLDQDYGTVEVGKKADLLIVELLDGYPVITHVLVDGVPTVRMEYRR